MVQHMQDNTTSTILDSTANNNDGTKLAVNQPVEATGKIGEAQNFDGTNDYVTLVGTPLASQLYNNFTIAVWYKSATNTVADDQYIFSHQGPSNQVTFGPTDDVGSVDTVRLHDGTPTRGTIDIVDQQWHHLVGIRASGRIRLYVDGALDVDTVDGENGTLGPMNAGPWIGDDPGNTEQVNGFLDEVRISNIALSSSWINTSYLNQNSPSTFFNVSAEEGWMRWNNASNPDTSSPWSWNFNFPNGTEYYQFFSIATDNATNQESMPGSADASCHYVTAPVVNTNASTGVEETNATLWGYLQTDGGENCTVRFEYGTSTSYGTNTTNQTKITGQTFSADITSLTKGQLYYYRAFANNTLESDSGADQTFLTKPDPPNTLNAQPNSSSMIYLTWNTGIGANNTYIERNASGQTIWTRGQGEFVYNGSAINYEDSGRNPGTTYYYQAWSFTTWTSNPTLSRYSDDNDSTSATTGADISIGVTPFAWDQGTILIGSSNSTTGSYFNLTNQGVVPINIQIKATNATNATTGAKWNLTGSSGLDNFSLQYKKSGDISWTTINLTYDTFMLNLPATGTDWQTFDLNLIMATTSSTGDPLSLTITFKSVAA